MLMFSLTNVIIGLLMAGAGTLALKYNFQLVNLTGSPEWIESKLGSGATYGVYKILAILVALAGLIVAAGLGNAVLGWILSPLKDLWTPRKLAVGCFFICLHISKCDISYIDIRRSMSNPSSQPTPLSPATFHILLALATAPRHGYGIMKQAEQDSRGSLRLGPGTLYGTLKRLLETGHVQEADEQTDPSLDDQRRRYYRITPTGQAALSLELERLDRVVQTAQHHGLLPHRKLDNGLGRA
jgi:DNA-binding PadR family transcriptional regulator